MGKGPIPSLHGSPDSLDPGELLCPDSTRLNSSELQRRAAPPPQLPRQPSRPVLTHSLAGPGVRVHVESRPALALVAAFKVHTELAAGVRLLTLINILTSVLVHQLEATGTQALVANLEVLADVGTATIVVQALVGPAVLDGLIRPVPAVPGGVAHLVQGDTFTTVALERVGPITLCHIDAAKLVTQVPAVIFPVALAATVDAGAICTLEFVGPAGGRHAVLLVRLVLAVGTAVTDPAAVNALAAATVELQGGTGAATRGRGSVAAPTVLWPLIRAILTVLVPVTGPQAGDAGRGVAAELGRPTRGGLAVGLVRAIQAVLVLVTHELLGDALAIPAAELVRGARLGGTALLI